MESKTCAICKLEKSLTLEFFSQEKRNGANGPYLYWNNICRICYNKKKLPKNREHKKKNRRKLADAQKIYHSLHKEQDALTKKIWYENNKDEVKLRVKLWRRERRKNDIGFRLKDTISSVVRSCINKNRESISEYLLYTMQELKDYLESLFEPWMNWENWGTYRISKWDNNDKSTWTWQLDHITPHSTFNYTNMKEQSFIDCWALDNLRPYSAKQNILDGNRR